MLILFSSLQGETIFPSVNDDWSKVVVMLNRKESKAHNDFLFTMLDYPLDKYKGFDKPVPIRAQIILFKRFRNSGFPGPLTVSNESEIWKKNRAHLEKWLNLNYSKIAYNEDGTHYFTEAPIGVNHITGETILIEYLRQNASAFRETKTFSEKNEVRALPNSYEVTIPNSLKGKPELLKKPALSEESKSRFFPWWLLGIVGLITLLGFILLKGRSK